MGGTQSAHEAMARGPKKHLKRLNAPKHWMLDKLGGIWAPRPSTGPHKLRECLPLIILLRNRLKYALTGKEVKYILMQRLIKVDGKARTDAKYPDPLIKAYDTIKLDLETGKITDFVKFDSGNLAMISGGKNTGRVGIIVSREKHQGSFDIVHLKDTAGHVFATRLSNVFVIGNGNRPMISLPRRKGIKMSILEERVARPPKM